MVHKSNRGTQWLVICNLPVATAGGNLHSLLPINRSSKKEVIPRPSAASLADRPRKPTKLPEVGVVTAAEVMAAVAATALALQPAPLSSVRVAASRPRFPLNLEATVRFSAAIASRRRRPAAVVAGVDAARATVAGAAADVTELAREKQFQTGKWPVIPRTGRSPVFAYPAPDC
jgi:hypothetical protein